MQGQDANHPAGPRPTGRTAILDRFRFSDGTTGDLTIGYWTIGTLDDRGGNAVLLCHGASGDRDWALPFCRVGGAFDTDRWFLVSIDLPGGGASSRASTTSGFPGTYTAADLTNAIARFVEALGLSRLAAFSGASLASLVGTQLAATRPDLVGALALWNCGTRCDGYARAVVGAIDACLALDPGPAGLRAAAAAFLPAVVGRAFLDERDDAGRGKLVDAMAAGWAKQWRGDELAARYRCVGDCDLPAWHGGVEALAISIRCPTLWLPSSTDAIFPAADARGFASRLPRAEIAVCETDRGHVSTAAPPGSAEFAFYDGATAAFLARLPD